ncbi:MAG: PKD domain-containing protein [Terriglobales bacterium]
MKNITKFSLIPLILIGFALQAISATPAQLAQIQNSTLLVSVSAKTGAYTVREKNGPVRLTAEVAAKVNGQWIHSADFPKHAMSSSAAAEGTPRLTITHSGLAGQPDLVCSVRLHSDPAYAEVMVDVRNTAKKLLEVQGIRAIEIRDPRLLDLGGPTSALRILSDSFSEDRPAMAIHDFGDNSDGLYRGVGSQLLYNRQSKQSLFIAALSSEKWLTILRLHALQAKLSAYEVESAGTTELETENSLETSSAEDRVELSLPVAPGKDISSESVMLALGPDYHAQLEAYGTTIRDLHHARVTLPSLIGWWSWTAYYFGLNQGAALTNAQLLSEHLKEYGYNYFHIDEGYQYARGEYTTENTATFPDGMKTFEAKVQHLGLVPGIWTAPFEVSERSWVYQHHKDWLIRNLHDQPIHAGFVINNPQRKKQLDQLYMLDTTNPGAQNYLRETYGTLAHEWGIRYIKLDFMDDSAIEGRRYQPNTTAMEAQRIGLQVIREAVGENVILDKDGSAMLNPVGLVDSGRISQDTGHTFQSSHDAAPGVAARYYMNRNFYVSDPDAFTVSRQTVDEQEWHGGKRPLTLDEARVSIALSAVAGGMFEIGDDLPTLFADADRMALVENRDLINMARLGRASLPVDLMTYAPEDTMPSIYVLHESKRQSIVTIFNWTEKPGQHQLQFADLGLPGAVQISDVLEDKTPFEQDAASISLSLAPHSVRILKIVDNSIPAAAPQVSAHIPENASVGKPTEFAADTESGSVPALVYHWDFGDGASVSGPAVQHTFTHRGTFTVHLTADGIEGIPFEKSQEVSVSGSFDTTFNPEHIVRRKQ